MNFETPPVISAKRQQMRSGEFESQDALLGRVTGLPLEVQYQIFDHFDVHDLAQLRIDPILARHPSLVTPLADACKHHCIETLGAVPPRSVQHPADWIRLLQEVAGWYLQPAVQCHEPPLPSRALRAGGGAQPTEAAPYSALLSAAVDERQKLVPQMPWRRPCPHYFLTATSSELSTLARSRLPENMIVAANRLHALEVFSIDAQVDQWIALILQDRQAEAKIHGHRVFERSGFIPAAYKTWVLKPLFDLQARREQESLHDMWAARGGGGEASA